MEEEKTMALATVSKYKVNIETLAMDTVSKYKVNTGNGCSL